MNGQTWRYLDTGPASAARNMEQDERLLAEAASGGVPPALRFYTWDPPAVSIGRFQDESSAVDRRACEARGFDIVRRITGGRAVLHRSELTYSIIAPAACPLFPNDVIGTYKVIARGLLAGLRVLGLPAEMAARPVSRERTPSDPACFSSPSLHEILVRGRKIVGSAQRRVPGAFLQHGSILLEYDPALEAAVIPGGGREHAVTSVRAELTRPVTVDEIKEALRTAFADTFQIALSF